MRLAHFSDVHVMRFPLLGQLAAKRLAAVASYTLMGRGRHFVGSFDRLVALLDDVDGLGVDHALCTGDLTGVATRWEMDQAARAFGGRLAQPSRYTCLPGNHDRYVVDAAGLFERHFAALCEGASSFPFVKRLAPGVVLVGLDVALPRSIIDSSGEVGDAQLGRLEAVLTDASLREQFVILALHYGLFRRDGSLDTRSHGLTDATRLIALLQRPDVVCDLVLHGHLHRPFVLRGASRLIANAGSGTDLHVRSCGYNVYEIDPPAFRVTIRRREWDGGQGRYVEVEDSPLRQEHLTRG